MTSKKTTLCTICARGGSKGLPGKNLMFLQGIPLIQHSINQALECKDFIDKIIVSSDSEEILSAVNGVDFKFKRTKSLSSDKAGKLDVIRNAYNEAEDHFGKDFDSILDLDVTSPLRIKSDIKEAYKKFIDDDASNLFSVTRSRKNPFFNMITLENNKPSLCIPSSFKTRQEAPEVFDMNASIYFWKKDALFNQKTLFQKNTSIYEMPQSRSIDIDESFDFELVEYLMGK